MLDLGKVKGILFDYGGTIDSNGMHWAEVIWMAYQECSVPVSKDVFRDAYVYGERTLGKQPVVQPHHTFRDMLLLKSGLQLEWLIGEGHLRAEDISPELAVKIADWCYNYAKNAIQVARPVLNALSKRYPFVLVSNFYGNIETVLKDFKLDHFFPAIIESAVVGVRKPDPAIFQLGVEEIRLPAEEVVVIGDSYDKDIIPSRQLGCQTIWLKSIGWSPYQGDETADVIIENFTELDSVFVLH